MPVNANTVAKSFRFWFLFRFHRSILRSSIFLSALCFLLHWRHGTYRQYRKRRIPRANPLISHAHRHIPNLSRRHPMEHLPLRLSPPPHHTPRTLSLPPKTPHLSSPPRALYARPYLPPSTTSAHPCPFYLSTSTRPTPFVYSALLLATGERFRTVLFYCGASTKNAAYLILALG